MMNKEFKVRNSFVLFFLLTIFSLRIYAEDKISISIVKGDVEEFIIQVEKKTRYNFVYSVKVNLKVAVTLKSSDITVK